MKYIEVEQQTQFLCIKEHDSMSPTQISGQNGNKCFCLFYDPKKKGNSAYSLFSKICFSTFVVTTMKSITPKFKWSAHGAHTYFSLLN